MGLADARIRRGDKRRLRLPMVCAPRCIVKSYAEQAVDAITMGMQPEYRAARAHQARLEHQHATGTMGNGQQPAAIDVYNSRISLLGNQQSQLDLQHTRCARKHK